METQLNTQSPLTAPSIAEPFIGKPETARRLNCSLRTLDAWMRDGLVPFYKMGRKVAFRWSEVQAALRENSLVNRGGWKL